MTLHQGFSSRKQIKFNVLTVIDIVIDRFFVSLLWSVIWSESPHTYLNFKLYTMIIRRSIYFALKPRKDFKGERVEKNLPIRMRVSFNWNYKDFYTGYNIDSDKWDPVIQRVKRNSFSKCGQSAAMINSHLNKMLAAMYDTFTEFEILDQIPDLNLITSRFNEKMAGVNEPLKALRPHRSKTDFWKIYQEFISESSQKRAWTTATVEKFEALRHHIKYYKEKPVFEDFDDAGLTAFMVSLRSMRKTLKNGREWKMKDSTIHKQVGYLKWFLKWANNRGYTSVRDYSSFNPKVKNPSRTVVFLTLDDMQKLKEFKIPESRPAWERVRDVCFFCCFSGLRYSDVMDLRWTNIVNNCIDLISKKDSEHLRIELNDVTSTILNKYRDCEFEDGRILPVISNSKMNLHMKDLFRAAGFTELITDVTYAGGQRIEHTSEKWTRVGTHIGRKSFICNALALGVPINVVMKWTGHSDYKSMKPYIDVADSIKSQYMQKFDSYYLQKFIPKIEE